MTMMQEKKLQKFTNFNTEQGNPLFDEPLESLEANPYQDDTFAGTGMASGGRMGHPASKKGDEEGDIKRKEAMLQLRVLKRLDP